MDLQHIDNLIRSGQSQRARAVLAGELRSGRLRRLGRSQYLQAAGLFRRSGWPEGGLVILNPIVRPSARTISSATSEEKSEYASCLIQIGLIHEARTLLSSIGSALPAKFLTEALTYFSEWDYLTAIPILRRGLSLVESTSYLRLILEVNLASALVFAGKLEEALPLLTRLRDECREKEYSLLLGNLFEISAQAELKGGRLDVATKCLDASLRLLQQHTSVDKIFLLKWQIILAIQRDGLTAKHKTRMNEVIKQAQTMRHWETWRDCHFHMALGGERWRASHLYFGTPHFSFRRRICEELSYEPPCDGYIWKLGSSKSRWELSVVSGTAGGEELKTGQAPQKLLACLCSDFYRPQTVPTIFASLYPDRHYNPVTVPMVVHQTLKRFRQWLSRNKLPLIVSEHKGAYRLHSGAGVKIHIPFNDGKRSNRAQRELELLVKKNPSLVFCRRDFCDQMGLSPRAANYRINELLNSGHLARVGAGPHVKYRIVEEI